MTKFKLKPEERTSSEVTLTSYLTGQDAPVSGTVNPAFSDATIERNIVRRMSKDECRRCKRAFEKNGSTVLDFPEDHYLQHKLPQYEAKPTAIEWLKERARNCCTKKVLKKRIPILNWLPEYKCEYIIPDFLAGLTVGLTMIPQAIAFAGVAGLPPQVGLYSSFMGCFIYTIFGSCKDASIGPTAIAALLTRENSHGIGTAGAVALCFLTGCVELIMGLLQLGFLIDFISGPVSIGFTSAAALIIATTQAKDILGLTYPGSEFGQVWQQIFEHISETRKWDCILGFSCMAILLFFRKIKDYKFGPDDEADMTKSQKLLNKTLWLICSSRNILVVVSSAILAYIFELNGSSPFHLTGFVKPGLPEVSPPSFHAVVNNQTYGFIQVTSTLGTGIIVLPLLSILESIALVKAVSGGKAVDATQEIISLGCCNLASCFVGSMPVSGALSRGAVNNASGVRTPIGSVYTGLIVLLSLQFLTPYLSYIPKASLAAVIIAATIFLVELHVFKPIWRTKKADLIPAIVTFLTCLFLRLEIGILLGIGINIIFLLYATARPSVSVEKLSADGCDYLLITPDRSLTFPSVEYVRSLVSKAGVKQGSSSIPVVIDANHIQGADFTAAKGIKSLIEDFHNRKQPILFFHLKQSVINTFQGVKPRDFSYCQTYVELNELLKQYSKCSALSNPSGNNLNGIEQNPNAL